MWPDISNIAELVWAQLLQVTVVLGIVAVLVRMPVLRRPHLAHALWLLVIIKCLTPPVLSSQFGAFSRLPALASNRTATAPAPPPAGRRPAAVGEKVQLSTVRRPDHLETEALAKSEPGTAPPVSVPIERRPPRYGVWVGLWLAGVAAVSAFLLARRIVVSAVLRRTACTVPDGLVSLVTSLASRLRIRRRIGIVVTSRFWGPAVFGVLRPRILMPDLILESRSDEQLEPIVAHELVHIRRGDTLIGLLQTVVQTVYWFHPLVWWASRHLSRERERCCDEEVIAGLNCSPDRYAQTLLDVLKLTRRLQPITGMPGIRPVELTSKRLEHIMNLDRPYSTRSPWWCRFVFVIGLVVCIPGAAWTGDADSANDEGPAVLPSHGTLRIAITEKGRFFVNGRELSLDQVEAEAARCSDNPLVIRACRNTKHRVVVRLTKRLQSVEGVRILIAVADEPGTVTLKIDDNEVAIGSQTIPWQELPAHLRLLADVYRDSEKKPLFEASFAGTSLEKINELALICHDVGCNLHRIIVIDSSRSLTDEPAAEQADSSASDPISIRVAANGDVTADSERIERDQLPQRLQEIANRSAKQQNSILILAVPNAKIEHVVPVIDALTEAGAVSVRIAVDQVAAEVDAAVKETLPEEQSSADLLRKLFLPHRQRSFDLQRDPLEAPERSSEADLDRSATLDALRRLNSSVPKSTDPEVMERIRQYELAFRLQTAVPELMAHLNAMFNADDSPGYTITIEGIASSMHDDLSAWFQKLNDRALAGMLQKDRKNPPTGDGWIIQVQGFHYSASPEVGEMTIREMLIKRLHDAKSLKSADDARLSHGAVTKHKKSESKDKSPRFEFTVEFVWEPNEGGATDQR